MEKVQCTVDIEKYKKESANFDSLKEAATKLLNAQESQFNEIKKEKWYNRVFDFVTFSHKNEKRMGEQIGSLAQAQNILMEILTVLSATDTDVAELARDNMEYIKRLTQNDLYLQKRLKHLENHILGITKVSSIDNLSEHEKSILSGCLYQLRYSVNTCSSNQQKYASELLKAINNNGDIVENLETALNNLDNNSKKIILTCCLEWIFLKNNAMTISESLENFIDCFDLGNRTLKELKKHVTDSYNLLGVDGIIAKYITDNFEDDNLFFDFEFEDDETDEKDTDNTTNNTELDEYHISSILHIPSNEILTITNKEVHISSYITCDGSLEFINCRIYYNESSSSDEITLNENASISFKNCIIVCCGYDEQPFIKGERNNSLYFESCNFEDCSNFVSSSDTISFKMVKCQINNCINAFIDIKLKRHEYHECIISDCLINEITFAEFNKQYFNRASVISITTPDVYNSSISEDKNCLISNITVISNSDLRKCTDEYSCYETESFLISCPSGRIEKSTFVNTDYCLNNVINVENCKFKNCKYVIAVRTIYDDAPSSQKAIINNCNFEDCTAIIFCSAHTHISYCRFQNCYDELITSRTYKSSHNTIEYCEFYDIEFVKELPAWSLNGQGHACIKIGISKEKGFFANTIKNCIFDGISTNTGFLIQAYGYDKPRSTIAYIENCDFRNCSTQRSSGAIIKTMHQYDTLLKKNIDIKAINITNCRGLDKVNKEANHSSKQPDNPNKSVKGESVGSNVANIAGTTIASVILSSAVGLAGFAAFPIGAASAMVTAHIAKTEHIKE